MPGEDVKAPALGISVQCTAGAHQIVFQTHVDQETDKAGLDKLVDRLTAVADRQQAKATLNELRANRKQQVAQLQNLLEDRARIDAQYTAPQDGRRNPRPNDSEKRAREQSVVMEKKLNDVLERFDADIAAAEKTVKGE